MACCSGRDDDLPQRLVVGGRPSSLACRDPVFAILFLGNLVALIWLFIWFMQDHDLEDHLNASFAELSQHQLHENLEMASRGAAYALFGNICLAAVWLFMCRFAPTVLIVSAQLLLVVACVAGAVIFAAFPEALHVSTDGEATHQPGHFIAVFFLALLAALTSLYLCCNHKRIAFTALILSQVTRVLQIAPELLVLKLGLSKVVLLFGMLWVGAYLELLGMLSAAEASFGLWALGHAWALFSLFWVAITLINVALVTACATVAAWYFSPSTFTKGCFCFRPAVYWGLLRSFTVSFGSIAFGSFVIAFVKNIVLIMQHLARRANDSGSLAKLLCCCFICCLRGLDQWVTWMTDYAFVYVAIYGTSFITSGSRVASLMGREGLESIVHETLLYPLLWLATALGLAVGCVCGYVAHTQVPETEVWLPVLCGALVGSLVISVGVSTIQAGCNTLFICYAEEPHALRDLAPELHARLRESSPLKDTAYRAPDAWSRRHPSESRIQRPSSPPPLISP